MKLLIHVKNFTYIALADYCLLYLPIKSEQDSILLQRDLDTLSLWAKVWQMRFNLSKCTIIRCTRSHNPIIVNYSLHGFTLSATNKHTYLGVMLNDHLSWSIHVTNVANIASRMLNFLKRHLSKCSSNVKPSAYLIMVHPLMLPFYQQAHQATPPIPPD